MKKNNVNILRLKNKFKFKFVTKEHVLYSILKSRRILKKNFLLSCMVGSNNKIPRTILITACCLLFSASGITWKECLLLTNELSSQEETNIRKSSKPQSIHTSLAHSV